MKLRVLLVIGCALAVAGCGSGGDTMGQSGGSPFAAAMRRPTPCIDTVLCIRGSHWSPEECQCVPDVPGSCASDAECQVVPDYCTGCECLALAVTDPDPTCSGPGVQCFADPCMNRTATCVNGQCTLACVETQLCVRGAHWDPNACACVADGPHAPHAPHAPHGTGGARGPHTPHQPHTPHHA